MSTCILKRTCGPHLGRLAARGVHWALYALLVIQSVIGWIGTSAYPAPVPFFGLYFGLFEMPQIWWEDRQLSNRLLTAHLWIGIFVAILLVAHIGAALRHHLVRRDEILLRMLRG